MDRGLSDINLARNKKVPSKKTIWNFGKNVSIKPESYFQPTSSDELLTILNEHRGKKLRAVGSLHAWSDAAKTQGVVIELSQINSIEVDQATQTVTVGGGCRVKHLLAELSKHGLTLPSVGLIDEQTVAGAAATATHGSGKHSLSHYIESTTIAHYDNESGEAKLTTIDSGLPLQAARCSIGLLGVVVAIRFRCRPQYNICEHAKAHPSLDSVLDMESDHPQQQFYLMPWSWTYFGHHRVETDRPRSFSATIYRWYCFLVIDVGLHIAIYFLAKLLKQAWAIRFFFKRILPLTIARNWKVVDDSHAMLTMEHELFRHIEIELFVQRSQVRDATKFLIDVLAWFGGQAMIHPAQTEAQLKEVEQLNQLPGFQGRYVHHYPICYRRIENDDALISSAACSQESEEDWYAISLISFHWPGDRKGFFQFADFIGPVFAKLFGGRCHWGKYNPLNKQTNEQLYPQLPEFRKVVEQFDKNAAFKNDWLDQVI